MLRRTAFTALVVCLRMAIAADGPVPDLVPPGTRAIIGFHLRTIIDSSLVHSLGADLFKNAGAKLNTSSLFPGVDPLKDLDEVIIASTMEGDHPPTLVICRGRFHVDQLPKGTQRYHGVPIKGVRDGDGIALLDAGTLLGGSMNDLRAAIDRRDRHSAGLDPALAEQAGQLSAQYAIWGAGRLPQDFHPPAGGPEALKTLDRFSFGIGLNSGLQLTANIRMRSSEELQKLASNLQMFEMMAKAQPDTSGAKLDTHIDNGTLTLSLTVPEEALKKAVAQQRAAIAQALAQAKGQPLSASEPSAKADSSAPPEPPASRPASRETTIVSDKEGASVQVTLPGKRLP
jgi:hypothetical protein